jgi:hypothetical protein
MAIKRLGRPLWTGKMFKDFKEAGEYAHLAEEYGSIRTVLDKVLLNKNGFVVNVLVQFETLHQLEAFEAATK